MFKSKWKKVNEIKVGDKIAIVRSSPDIEKTELLRVPAKGGDKGISDDSNVGSTSALGRIGTGTIDFDEIVSIKKVGFERVWDIEVENTHNFVGNGILAHNTYINGNVGIGTTAPSYVLDVQHDSSKINSKNGYLTNGADYAEYFSTKDTDLEAGEAVCIDTINSNSVSRCKNANDINIMGIVSTNPAFLGNASLEKENNPNYKAIAMLGQIPAKVTDENGAVRIGDSLTSASIPGHLMKANAGDSTVGVALEPFGSSSASSSLVEDQADSGLSQNDGDSGTGDALNGQGNIGTGVVQVMISRRNKSLTVEAVEEKVTERIAGMKIEDEVNLLVANAVASLTPANTLTLDTNGNVVFTNDPTKTVDILANNAEIRNVTDSLVTLQSDYETLKNTTEERIAKIESTILSSVFEKEYKAEAEIQIGEIVSFDGEKVVKAGGENRDMILGVVSRMSSSSALSSSLAPARLWRVEDQADSGLSQNDGNGDAGQGSSTSDNIGTGTATVTTRGRVRVQVTKENGEIKKGDAITSSTANNGFGTKAVTEGMIIGYAQEDAVYEFISSSSLVEDQVDSGLGQNDSIAEIEIAIAPVWYALSSSPLDSGLSQNDGGVILSQAQLDEGSSNVSLLSLTIENNTLLNGDLNVLGNTNISDLFVSGDINVGSLALSSTDNSINVAGQKLKLQNTYGAGDVEIFVGKIVLTSSGDIKVLGTIEADKIKVNELEVQGGITIKDKVTGEYYCVTVSGGNIVNTLGSCEIN